MSRGPAISGPATPEEAAAAIAAVLARRPGATGAPGATAAAEGGIARWRHERIAALRRIPPTSG